MKLNKLFFVVLALLITAIISISSSASSSELLLDSNNNGIRSNGIHVLKCEDKRPLIKRKSSRFLAQKPRVTMTCDKYPRVCVVKGSLAPNCCNRQCVNVKIDRVNCGKCGKKCKYQEICCKEVCVNPSFDGKNYGNCKNRCNSGSSCLYGMCSYA